jgi:site-specific recombinase
MLGTLRLARDGLLNFSVSFAFGLWLALRARNLGRIGRKKLVRALRSEIRRRPSRFLWRHESATELAIVDG